jgi:hypothetical protein
MWLRVQNRIFAMSMQFHYKIYKYGLLVCNDVLTLKSVQLPRWKSPLISSLSKEAMSQLEADETMKCNSLNVESVILLEIMYYVCGTVDTCDSLSELHQLDTVVSIISSCKSSLPFLEN